MYPDIDGTPKKPKSAPAEQSNWPEHWLRQFKYYTLEHYSPLVDQQEYYDFQVAIMYLGAAQLVVGTLSFTPSELIENYYYIQQRKETYTSFIRPDQVVDNEMYQSNLNIPKPFTHNSDWECEHCRYNVRCQLRKSIEKVV